MERIVRHFLGDISFDGDQLQETADLLENGRYPNTPRDMQDQEDDDAVPDSYSLDALSANTMRMGPHSS